MNTKEILKILDKYEAKSSHPQLPVVWKQAIGSIVYTEKKSYVDFTSGIFVTSSGHSAISRYLIHQINKGLIYSYTYPTEIKARLIKKLVEITPDYLEKVALATTGAEAVEIALKLLRLAYNERNPIKDSGYYISIKGSMHGKTRLTEALNGKWINNEVKTISFPNKNSSFKEDFEYIDPSKIYGIILESYQGWSARFMSKDYIKDLIKYSKKHNILICFDEVQGGFWRTGKLFAYEHYEIKPDLVCLGKGLGGGVPISAVIGKAKLLDIADDLTATFSGNPLSCAGALSNLKILDELNKEHLIIKSTSLRSALLRFRVDYLAVKRISCKGLLGGIVFKDTKTATKVCKLAEKKGLLVVYTDRESVKLGPPLTIPLDKLQEGIKILESCIKEL